MISFGFKYGIPVDADFVADMRFLPNPFWVPELRPHNGRDEAVADYVKLRPSAQTFLDQYLPMLENVAGGYLTEGKRFMKVAIGCTGGKHRSVAMTEEIAARLKATASTPAPATATSGGSDTGWPAPPRSPRSPSAAATGSSPPCRRCGTSTPT